MRLSQAEWERLRDEFAGQAMAALLTITLEAEGRPERIAEEAYAMADAMLAVRGNQ